MKMHIQVIFIFLLVSGFLNGEGARVLGIFHHHSKSHHILGSALLKALASKGHQVTMLSPYPLKTPIKNYEDIELTDFLEFAEKNRWGFSELQNVSLIERASKLMVNIDSVTEMVLNHTAVKNLLNSGRKFDLVIQNWFFNHAHLGIANHFKVPVIGFSTFGASTSSNKATANPSPYSYVPFLLSAFPNDMTFLQRVGNTLTNIFFETMDHFVNEPTQQRLLHKYFPKAPPLQELVNNVSLILLNSHFSIESPRPYVPNMIQVGGLHVEDAKELDKDLKSFMDSAKGGVLFFSLGSNLRVSDLTEEKVQAIISCFEKLPLKVLWKFESEKVPKLPANVKIGKWLPQREILAHPNTKIFVTHGGMLSTTEAIYHGVPMVGIPFFADQHNNVADGVSKGYAIKVAYDDLSEKTLTSAIMEILKNARYRVNIKTRSRALRDQPLKPIDNAVYWVEYVLRHKGAPHLKTSATKLRWYQYYLVDVFAFIIAIVVISLYVIFAILKMLLKLVSNFKSSTKSKTD